MLRRSFLVMLVLALLAGPALAAHAAAGNPGCEHASMQGLGGDCGHDGDMAAGACALHCAVAWTVVATIPAVYAMPAGSPPVALTVPLLGCRAGPPDTAPPKS